jgi:hypothetical protein
VFRTSCHWTPYTINPDYNIIFHLFQFHCNIILSCWSSSPKWVHLIQGLQHKQSARVQSMEFSQFNSGFKTQTICKSPVHGVLSIQFNSGFKTQTICKSPVCGVISIQFRVYNTNNLQESSQWCFLNSIQDLQHKQSARVQSMEFSQFNSRFKTQTVCKSAVHGIISIHTCYWTRFPISILALFCC